MGGDDWQKQESKDNTEATAVAGTVGNGAGQLNSTHAKSSVEKLFSGPDIPRWESSRRNIGSMNSPRMRLRSCGWQTGFPGAAEKQFWNCFSIEGIRLPSRSMTRGIR